MRRTHQALATLALGLALVGGAAAMVGWTAATPPTPTPDSRRHLSHRPWQSTASGPPLGSGNSDL